MMAQRSLLCWSMCCKPAIQVKDEGEWMEPINNKKKKRHVSQIENVSNDDKRSTLVDNKQKSVRWSDLVDNLNQLDISDLNNPKHDEQVLASFNSSLNSTDYKLSRSLGSLSMDLTLSEDSVIEGLGPFHEKKPIVAISAGSVALTKKITSSTEEFTSSRPMAAITAEVSKSFHEKKPIVAISAGSGAIAANMSKPFHEKKTDVAISAGSAAITAEVSKPFHEKKPLVAISSGLKKVFHGDSKTSNPVPTEQKDPAITSIAVLSDGFFLTASRSGEKVIKMYKTVRGKIEFVRDFSGHKSGISALATLDRKGRFLSAGMDKTLKLWDSRFYCEDEPDDEGGILQDPMVLLASFHCSDRLIHSIEVLNEGSFVRPTDDIDMAIVAAMAKKMALEGTPAVQRAAIQREIIECSGSFATASKNDKSVSLWNMTIAEKGEENGSDKNVAEINLANVLKHDTAIGAMSAREDTIITGDEMGVVYMWERKQTRIGSLGGFASDGWEKVHKFTPWRNNVLYTPDEMSEQAILRLCILRNGTFVSGTISGKVRVWDDIESIDEYEVYKKHSNSANVVTSGSLTAIQCLPPVKDPNTREDCLAFSVASTDGNVRSMASYPQDRAKRLQNDLVMFHVYDNIPSDNDSKIVIAVESIAVVHTAADSSWPILIAGDGNGDIKTLKPEWHSVAEF